MRKDFGKQTWLYPMPVLIIGTYDEDKTPNAMNAAWGGIYDTNQIMICLAHDHKTTKNIKLNKAFTINIANREYMKECDYVGIVSGNKVKDKFAKVGFTAVPSEYVNAPIINELPMALECELLKFNEDGIVVGKIINVSANEEVLDENGKIDYKKMYVITYDPINYNYIELGESVGCAFKEGKKIK